jgi:hypothetical protein
MFNFFKLNNTGTESKDKVFKGEIKELKKKVYKRFLILIILIFILSFELLKVQIPITLLLADILVHIIYIRVRQDIYEKSNKK